ncbi:MAG: heavy metal translocating P-type ATPase [Peptococcaceae bacterium]|nr:heavy metal translocating P-type ATPase [Peptococcaceae bacterium]
MRKELFLEGLGCAGCAAKIEKDVNALAGVTASINFMTKVLVLETYNAVTDSLLADVNKIIQKIEPDIVAQVIESGQRKRITDRGRTHFIDRITAAIKGTGGLIAGAILFVWVVLWSGGVFGQASDGWVLGCYLAAYGLIGGKILVRAWLSLVRGRFFNENMLMSIATIGAFAIQEYPEGVAVMLFYRIGEMLQDMAVNRSRRSIGTLMDIRPETAALFIDGELTEVTPEDVRVGDVILVKAGERIPLDGRIIDGGAALDVSALTGESLPRDVDVGDDVLAGSINTNGVLSIEVGKVFGESALSKILDLVENAGHKKASTEKFITKFAHYYTPLVVVAAVFLAIMPPLVLPGALWSDWIYRALLFLVVSCPCALVISIPLTFFAGIGAASRRGILVKGSHCLEGLIDVDKVVIDKTGTLTRGVFNVVGVETAKGFREEDVLRLAGYAEWFSNHPIALSIQRTCREKIEAGVLREIDPGVLTGYEEIAGYGVRVLLDGSPVLAGNTKLMDRFGVAFTPTQAVGSVVYVAKDDVFAGCVVVADEIKQDSLQAVGDLQRMGVSQIVMLTGDSLDVAEDVARKTGLDQVHAELLPHEKVEFVEGLRDSGKQAEAGQQAKPGKQAKAGQQAKAGEQVKRGRLIFVGDGVNDAPALAVSDIGFAMGGLGSDAAIEAADVVLMTDELSKVPEAIRIARKTNFIVIQNIAFALGVKLVVLAFGALGFADMWQAVFADVGVTLLAVLNALRANF